MNWRGGLIDRCGAPLLGAHGTALGATLVVLVVRHGGHWLARWTSLNTGTYRSEASSDSLKLTAFCSSEKQSSGSLTIASISFLLPALTESPNVYSKYPLRKVIEINMVISVAENVKCPKIFLLKHRIAKLF